MADAATCGCQSPAHGAACFVVLGAFACTGRSSLTRTSSASWATYPMHMSVPGPTHTETGHLLSCSRAFAAKQASSPWIRDDDDAYACMQMQVPLSDRCVAACLEEPTGDVRTRPMHGARMTYIWQH